LLKRVILDPIDGTEPKMNDKGYLNIKKGKTSTFKRSCGSPLMYGLGDEFRILVITGPNTGGKNGYTKNSWIIFNDGPSRTAVYRPTKDHR